MDITDMDTFIIVLSIAIFVRMENPEASIADIAHEICEKGPDALLLAEEDAQQSLMTGSGGCGDVTILPGLAGMIAMTAVRDSDDVMIHKIGVVLEMVTNRRLRQQING